MNTRPWLLVLCLFLSLSAWSAGDVQAGQSIEGVFTVLHGDPEPGSGGKSQLIPMLSTDDGRWIELDLEGASLPPGGIPALVNKRVRIDGDLDFSKAGTAAPRLKARAVQRLAIAVPKVTGNQKFVSVLCKFGGNANEPRPPAYFTTQLGAANPGFNHYFREASYNALTMDGSASTTAWVSMPKPMTFYLDGKKESSVYLDELFNDCTAAAAALVDYTQYFGINLMFNDRIGTSAWGGGRFVTLNGVQRFWAATWMPYSGEQSTFGWRDHGVLGHEMSHAYGAPHSAAPNGFEYGSAWDVVSDPSGTRNLPACKVSDTNYGCISQSMNAYAKITMEVMPAARISTHNGGSGIYNIERMVQPPNAAGTTQMLRIVLANDVNRFYTVESRFRIGYDVALPGDGVIIHEVNTTRNPPAWLVTPPGMPLDDGAMAPVWRPGMTFGAVADNVSITVNSVAADGTASISVGPYAAVTDNWPAGCAVPAGWTMSAGAAAGWAPISTVGAYGTCSLKSATLANPTQGSMTSAGIQFTGGLAAGNVTFLARVSSTGGPNCLRFLIDNAQQNIGACAAGGLGLTPDESRNESGWRFYSFPVTAGTHTLAWSFEKTQDGAADDAAYVDSVMLPSATGLGLSVAKAGTGNGTISSTPAGIDCGVLCATSLAAGTAVTLTATPAAGSQFAGWSGGCTGTGTCTVTLNAATTVLATFNTIPLNFAVTVTKHGNGTITSAPAGINCGTTCSGTFAAGTSVTLTATPPDGAVFGGWNGACTGTGACTITISAAANVVATFNSATETFQMNLAQEGNGTGTVVSAPAGINCGATCVANFASGTSVTLTATPAARSRFSGWGSGPCEGNEPSCTVTMDEGLDVSATFDIITYDLTVASAGTGTGAVTSAPAGIACGTTCIAPFNSGTVVTLTATAQAGSQFSGWSGACTGTGTCTVTLNAVANVTATFNLAAVSYSLALTKAGAGSGTASSTPSGIACGSACSASFLSGATVTLTATAAAGSTFGGWSGACTGTSTCTVTMNAAASVTATFNQIIYTLTTTRQGTGAGTVATTPAGISCGATCSAGFASGASVTLSATATAGSVFAGWGGACAGTTTCTVTIAAATSVTATFNTAPTTFALTVAKAGTGGGTVTSAPDGIACGAACSANYSSGTTVRITASPSPGSTFSGWSGACSGTSECIVTLGAAANVTATFDTIAGFLVSVTTAGTGLGTVTSSPAGISCGTSCFATFAANASVTLTATPTAGSTFAGWSGACTGTGTCGFTANATRSVTATFSASLQPSPVALDFGGQSMRTASPSKTVRFSNPGASIITTAAMTVSPGFTLHNACGLLAPGSSCVATVTFLPQAEGPITGTLTLQDSALPVTIPLAGVGERSLVTHYYLSILRRAPDAAGKAFWDSEANRVVTLGANVNEAWYALSGTFYTSPEYLAFNRSDTDFVSDMYRTFFARSPDAAGLAYWVGQITGGLPREIVLTSFMFSSEFVSFTQSIFGRPSIRAESDTVMDFFRGILGRLPDSAGFAFWLQQFRTAQCQGSGAVFAAASNISTSYFDSVEYTARNRSNTQYVGDLYNSFLRRGGDLAGVLFWINQLNTGAMTRKQVRDNFFSSPEFSARVNAIVAQGCLS